MAKKVIKKGEAPKVEVTVTDLPQEEVKLTWKMTEHPNGMREWTQPRATEDSRDLTIHWYNETTGHTVSIDSLSSTVSHFETPESAMDFCAGVVKYRRTPKVRKAAARRAAAT
jgi:hypothetical protein